MLLPSHHQVGSKKVIKKRKKMPDLNSSNETAAAMVAALDQL